MVNGEIIFFEEKKKKEIEMDPIDRFVSFSTDFRTYDFYRSYVVFFNRSAVDRGLSLCSVFVLLLVSMLVHDYI
jgi:hypothetical protein